MNPNETQNTGGATGTTPAQQTPSTQDDHMGKTGPIIGILIIIAILVIGALYFWGEKLTNAPADPANMQTEESVSFQPTESASSEIADIETDLSATALEGLDTELNSINQELGI